MSREDRIRAAELCVSLEEYARNVCPLPGAGSDATRRCLAQQIVESDRRVRYVAVMRGRQLSVRRVDPQRGLFDPVLGAIVMSRQGNVDEAYWLTFLFVHFGKHGRSGWRRIAQVYGALGGGDVWSWDRVSRDPDAFRDWLDSHVSQIQGGFGNHRKRESMNARSANGTGAVVASYVDWVGPDRSHDRLIQRIPAEAAADPGRMFDYLYESMDAVTRFGRTARFDYLTMVGKLGLASIEPPSPYLQSATGPLTGTRLLFTGDKKSSRSASDLEPLLIALGNDLGFNMQVMEDAICNWQKSPAAFKAFRG